MSSPPVPTTPGRPRAPWAPARLALVALAVGVAVPAPAGLAAAGPRVGDPCRSVTSHPVVVSADPDGEARGAFQFAGGMATGSLPLPAGGAAMARTHQALVSDARLGSYEPSRTGPGVVCTLGGTYHFFCPTTGALDQLCFTWATPPDRRRGAPR